MGGPYTSYEAGATGIKIFEPQYIPGLFQTEAYAAAVAQATLIRNPDDIARAVEARMRRQQLLTQQEDRPFVWAVIHEAALLMLRSHPELFHPQVDRLIELAEAPNDVTIQVLTMSAGLHAGMGGPFVILDYEDAAAITFLETNTDGLYLEKPTEVTRYRQSFDRLVAKALDPDEVPAYLRALAA
ncbi:DUF5753 domain-containing protein [Nocardiopsis sp. B62]|uniref:DUF5753 domain-containing protein n=1 Tax=Nocardiopsis sp. B62 TaxID=2824874 RepID=UPI0027DE1856|nr:DUF5753 domain-containing protein [Nocardiopsis sp. B62]